MKVKTFAAMAPDFGTAADKFFKENPGEVFTAQTMMNETGWVFCCVFFKEKEGPELLQEKEVEK